MCNWKVLVLLHQLQGQVEGDHAEELKAYNRLACWCESHATKTATDLQKAHDDVGTLGTRILSLKGAMETLTREVAEINAEIKTEQEGWV